MTQQPRSVPQRREGGFILALTLWIIALMGLAMAAIGAWVDRASENAVALQHRADLEIGVSNVKNDLVYLLAVRPLTYRGLEVGADMTRPDSADFNSVMAANYQSSRAIVFDGRPYIVESSPDFVAQFYDPRGLINLNTVQPLYLRRLLSLYDVPEVLRNRLPDTLLDWIDEDDLTRLSGAERSDYERLGRIPPSNANLLTPLEAQSILDWDQVPKLWAADLKSPILTTCNASGMNPNDAVEQAMLTYFPGLTREGLAQVLKRRAEKPFRNSREFMATAGILVPNEAFFFAFAPAPCVIVEVTDRVSGDRTRLSVSLAAASRYQPWQVDYVFKIPPRDDRIQDRPLDSNDPKVVFPAPETINPFGRKADRGDGVTP